MAPRSSTVAVLVVLAVAAACGSESAAPSTSKPATTTATTSTSTSTSTNGSTSTTQVTDRSVTLFDFVEAGSVGDWSNVDDTVMGGVSSSTTTWQDGRLVFAGELSLDNNGGFTSTRGPVEPALGDRLAGADAITVTATGDGSTYLLQLRTTGDQLYVQRFPTDADVERTYALALDAFEPVGRFLDPLPGAEPLDPAEVEQVVIYLLDEQEGSFRLAVRRIAAA